MTLLLYIQYLLGSRSVANSTASYIAAHTLFDTSIQCTWQVQWHVRTFFWHALVQKLRTLIIGINHAPVESRSQTIPFRSARYMYLLHVSAWSNTAELNGASSRAEGKATQDTCTRKGLVNAQLLQLWNVTARRPNSHGKIFKYYITKINS